MTRMIRPRLLALILASLACSSVPAWAVDYFVGWYWNYQNGVLAPAVNTLNLNPNTWGSMDPWLQYIVVDDGPQPAEDFPDKASYTLDWTWVVNANAIPNIQINPLVLDPASWAGFDPVRLEYVVTGAKSRPRQGSGDKASYTHDWHWGVDLNGNPTNNENPLVLDPAAWTGFSPVRLEYVIYDNSPFAWTTVTFEQTQGPVPDSFGPVTVTNGEISNCGTSLLHAQCLEIPEYPTPGAYQITATVQPGGAQFVATIQVPVDWMSVTFAQINGPAVDIFGPVTVTNGVLSNCGTSLLNAQCLEFPVNPLPGTYGITATVQPGGAQTQANIQVLPEWTSVTFTQIAGPGANVFGPVTVTKGEISACGSILNARCIPIPRNPAAGNYTIQGVVNYAKGRPPVTFNFEVTMAEGTIVVEAPAAVPAVSGWDLGALAVLMGAGAAVLLRSRIVPAGRQAR